MFNVIGNINWVAVITAAVACFALGGVWFAVLIPKHYALALGNDPNKKAAMTTLSLAGPFICNLVVIVASAILFKALGIQNMADGLVFGVIVGVGLVTATMVNIAINPNFPKPFYYAAINAPYFIACSLITGAILVVIR